MKKAIFLLLSFVASIAAQASSQGVDKATAPACCAGCSAAICSASTYPALGTTRTYSSSKAAPSIITDTIIFPVIAISGGVSLAKLGDLQSHRVNQGSSTPAYNTFAYHADSSRQDKGLFGLFIGAQYRLSPSVAWQPGIAYYQSSAYKLRGDAKIEMPEQEKMTYHHHIHSRQVLFENKVLMTVAEKFHSYVLMGLGVGFNKASAFNPAEASSNSDQRLTVYADKCTKTFVYKLGVGVDYALTKNWRVGLGYRYANLGRADLGAGASLKKARNSHTIELLPLKQSRINSHEIVAQISYLCQ